MGYSAQAMKLPAFLKPQITILTNANLPFEWETNDETGHTLVCKNPSDLLENIVQSDIVLIHCDPDLLRRVVVFMWWQPWLRKPVLASDLVLREPRNILHAWSKRIWLNRVDHFLLPFRDITGYAKHYGITPQRCTFVAGKANMADFLRAH